VKAQHRTLLYVLGALMVVSAFGIAMAGANLMGYEPGQRRDHTLVGSRAPDLTMPIVSGQDAGDRVSLSAMNGRVVLLDFWASWCGPCRQSIPALNEVHARYGDRIDMYGVNVESRMPAGSVREAHRDFGAEFPTLQDESTEAQRTFGVTTIPTLVLIDRDGIVRWVHSGVPEGADVIERIDVLLGSNR
jgi:thiol-disulfide isomerase/thioredoxin